MQALYSDLLEQSSTRLLLNPKNKDESLEALRLLSLRQGYTGYWWQAGAGLINLKEQLPLSGTSNLAEALRYLHHLNYSVYCIFDELNYECTSILQDKILNLSNPAEENPVKFLFLMDIGKIPDKLVRDLTLYPAVELQKSFRLRDGKWLT